MRKDVVLLGRKNIGPTIAARLKAIGIRTLADLRAVGPAQVYRQIRASYPGTSLPVCYYLYSLQGALDDVHWDDLAPKVKAKLLKDAGATQRARRSRESQSVRAR